MFQTASLCPNSCENNDARQMRMTDKECFMVVARERDWLSNQEASVCVFDVPKRLADNAAQPDEVTPRLASLRVSVCC